MTKKLLVFLLLSAALAHKDGTHPRSLHREMRSSKGVHMSPLVSGRNLNTILLGTNNSKNHLFLKI